VRQLPDLEAPLSDGVVSLRRFTLDDVTEVTRACQDPEIVRWTASIPIPYTESDAQGWIEGHSEHWNSGLTASLAIVDATDGAFMGSSGVLGGSMESRARSCDAFLANCQQMGN
jgi:hypothetical protein